MLRECERTLRPAGLLVGYTIAIAPTVRPKEMEAAIESGPSAVGTSEPYPSLLEGAGFEVLTFEDVSAEFVRVADERVAGWERHWSEITADRDQWEEDLERVRRARDGARSGYLARYFVVARKR